MLKIPDMLRVPLLENMLELIGTVWDLSETDWFEFCQKDVEEHSSENKLETYFDFFGDGHENVWKCSLQLQNVIQKSSQY